MSMIARAVILTASSCSSGVEPRALPPRARTTRCLLIQSILPGIRFSIQTNGYRNGLDDRRAGRRLEGTAVDLVFAFRHEEGAERIGVDVEDRPQHAYKPFDAREERDGLEQQPHPW